MSKETDILDGVETLLSQPGVWIQGDLATTSEKELISPHHPKACHFCLIGAIYRIAGEMKDGAAPMNITPIRRAILEALPLKNADWNMTSDWNDRYDTTLNDVIGVVIKARSLLS